MAIVSLLRCHVRVGPKADGMANSDQTINYNLQLADLSRQFEEVGSQVEAIDSLRQPSGEELSFQANLLVRHKYWELITRYRGLVKTAGELVIPLCRQELIQVDGLRAFVAAYDLGELGGFVVDPASFFALLVGGPRLELRDRSGIGEFEKPNEGWPIQYRPASPRRGEPRTPSEMFEAAVNIEVISLPDRDQCIRYAAFCRSLIGPRLEVQSHFSEITELGASTGGPPQKPHQVQQTHLRADRKITSSFHVG